MSRPNLFHQAQSFLPGPIFCYDSLLCNIISSFLHHYYSIITYYGILYHRYYIVLTYFGVLLHGYDQGSASDQGALKFSWSQLQQRINSRYHAIHAPSVYFRSQHTLISSSCHPGCQSSLVYSRVLGAILHQSTSLLIHYCILLPRTNVQAQSISPGPIFFTRPNILL